MQRFIGTILVVVCLLGVIATPVRAGDVLGPGDIAIIGYNFKNPDELAFVCLRDISNGTEIRFTDNGWKSDVDGFLTGEGVFSWAQGCNLGDIVTLSPDYQNPSGLFGLHTNGDQLIAYQQIDEQPISLIFALNAAGSGWMPEGTNENNSALPGALTAVSPHAAVSILTLDNAIYSLPGRSFSTTSVALASFTNSGNWTGHNTTRQTMPTGSFSFTTTAVEVNEFKADTKGGSTPWFVIVGLVVIPTLVMLWKKPKRNCCQ
jgi:hypothetical protein